MGIELTEFLTIIPAPVGLNLRGRRPVFTLRKKAGKPATLTIARTAYVQLGSPRHVLVLASTGQLALMPRTSPTSAPGASTPRSR